MCHRYWPSGTPRMYGYFEIHPHAIKELPDFTIREFKIVDTRVSASSERVAS